MDNPASPVVDSDQAERDAVHSTDTPGHDAHHDAPRPRSRSIPAAAARTIPWRRLIGGAVVVLGVGAAAYWLVPLVLVAMNTVSTDDAYVNGHVTFVAPRVSGQVARVLVD